ncbi:hypothetical protein CFELI_13460 [Corynebacterium felinum]|uniref:Secreted protein n=1 Tax=Corynebacterium felinum TaxID=131318 RepID=A0ABU2B657_9CORY|nr:hypothetical protein [Corynebacterium felinum]WJY96271.1 hypothetical protein CFELI_13460 [Corynebacterium felinum]
MRLGAASISTGCGCAKNMVGPACAWWVLRLCFVQRWFLGGRYSEQLRGARSTPAQPVTEVMIVTDVNSCPQHRGSL